MIQKALKAGLVKKAHPLKGRSRKKTPPLTKGLSFFAWPRRPHQHGLALAFLSAPVTSDSSIFYQLVLIRSIHPKRQIFIKPRNVSIYPMRTLRSDLTERDIATISAKRIQARKECALRCRTLTSDITDKTGRFLIVPVSFSPIPPAFLIDHRPLCQRSRPGRP